MTKTTTATTTITTDTNSYWTNIRSGGFKARRNRYERKENFGNMSDSAHLFYPEEKNLLVRF